MSSNKFEERRIENEKSSTMHTERNNDRGLSMDGTVVDDSPSPRKSKGDSKTSKAEPDVSGMNAKLANPLGDKSDEDVMNDASSFAKEHNLPEEVLRKGALVAKRPKKFEEMSLLGEEDKEALRREISHPYSQPLVLWWLVIACSVAAAVQGADESVISGAQLYFPKQFGIDPTESDKNSWLEGLVNGAPYLCCAVFGCWLTDPLNNWFGRRGAIFITAFISFATCIWSACTNTWWHLFIARFFLGVGIGPKSATVPVFAAECTPAKIRGFLVMQWQTWTAFGIAMGYVADLVFYNVPDPSNIVGLNWRLMLGSAGFPALVVMTQVPFLPESPRWLIRKGRYEKAYNSYLRLRGSEILAARDLYYSYVLLLEESKATQGRNRFMEIFTVPRNRRAFYGSTIVMFGQQFCGVNAIVYYTSTIFKEANFTDIAALLASFGFGMINFLFAIPGMLTIDRFGRRALLLVTFPVMSVLLLFTGFCFWIPNDTGRIAGVALGIYLYCMAYSPGEGPVPFTYSAEVYPLYIRELGMSLATAILWFFNFVVSLTFPALLRAFKPQGAFAWYAAWCAILFVLILFFLPESKGYTLEELDQVFSVPTGVHAKYQLKWIRHFLKNPFTARKRHFPELYSIDDGSDEKTRRRDSDENDASV